MPRGGGEHHRSQQHDGGVQAQHGRDRRREGEDRTQQTAGPSRRTGAPSRPRRRGTAPRRRRVGRGPAPRRESRSPAPAAPPRRGIGRAGSPRRRSPRRRPAPRRPPPAAGTAGSRHPPGRRTAWRGTGIRQAPCAGWPFRAADRDGAGEGLTRGSWAMPPGAPRRAPRASPVRGHPVRGHDEGGQCGGISPASVASTRPRAYDASSGPGRKTRRYIMGATMWSITSSASGTCSPRSAARARMTPTCSAA